MKEDLRDEKVLFFLKFGVMISNGVPIADALANLEKESTNKALGQAAKKMNEAINAGKSLSNGMEDFPHLFDKHIIQLIKVGEEIGILDLILKIIPEHLLFGTLEQLGKTRENE